MYALTFGKNDQKIWGFSPEGRNIRLLECEGVEVLSDPYQLEQLAASEELVILSNGFAFEPAFLQYILAGGPVAARAAEDTTSALVVVKTTVGEAASAIKRMEGGASLANEQSVDSLGPIYYGKLRKRQVNLVYDLESVSAHKIEWNLYMGAYKGVTDFFTKHLWPHPAFWLTKASRALHLSPNMVTTISLAFVLYTTYAFYTGDFVSGLIAGWVMTILDTVDGKLARVSMQSSKWGDVYDHGIDLIHPPFWYVAWFYGLLTTLAPEQVANFTMHLWFIVVGYVLGRVLEGIFMLTARGQELWTWRPMDSLFRLWVSRRNPNLFLLSIAVVLGMPGDGFLWVSYWTIASLGYQGVRIIWALIFKARGGEFTTWMADKP
jgi:phosphatidylglycerophosphate synthase